MDFHVVGPGQNRRGLSVLRGKAGPRVGSAWYVLPAATRGHSEQRNPYLLCPAPEPFSPKQTWLAPGQQFQVEFLKVKPQFSVGLVS